MPINFPNATDEPTAPTAPPTAPTAPTAPPASFTPAHARGCCASRATSTTATPTPCCAGKSLGQQWLSELLPTLVEKVPAGTLQNAGAAFLAEAFEQMQLRSDSKAFATQYAAANELTFDKKRAEKDFEPVSAGVTPCPSKVSGRDFLIQKMGYQPSAVHYDYGVWALCEIMKAWRSDAQDNFKGKEATEFLRNVLKNKDAWLARLDGLVDGGNRQELADAVDSSLAVQATSVGQTACTTSTSCCAKKK